MNLYLLERQEDIGRDEYVSMLIRAESEDKAREIANKVPGEWKMWGDKERVSCEIVTNEGDEELIIGDFNAG